MIIRGKITEDHIAMGEPGSQVYCPLNLSLQEEGLRDVIVTSKAIKAIVPKKDNEEYLGILPPEIVEWIKEYDSRKKVHPIRYRLELE